jgi:TolB protein
MRQPAFSPDGAKIAVNGEAPDHMNLHVANADGSNLIEVTTNFEDGRPSWSPDGYRIVFDSNRHGDRRWRIYILDDVTKRTESDPLRSAGGDTFGRDPYWLPDGRIVYRGCDYWAVSANCGLYIVPPDGSGRRKLFDLNGGYGSGEEYDWTTERVSWAP